MPRTQRVRIIAGLSAVIVGIVVCIVGPVVCISLIPPVEPTDNVDSFLSHMASIRSAGNTGGIYFVGGLGLAFCGALVAFFEWARWYVTSPNNA